LMVKAAIEAHMRRMPRRLSERGKLGSFTVRASGSRRRKEGEVSTVDRFAKSFGVKELGVGVRAG
jgi:flagellar hook-length control protein FliK